MPLPLNRDYTTYDGAQVLAERIRAYWTRRHGLPPKVVVMPAVLGLSERNTRYDIRSGMIGGWP